MSPCAITVCDRLAYARGMCGGHYQRWRRDPEGFSRAPMPASTRRPILPNPWAGQVPCPCCASTAWTLPYDPDDERHGWRCVDCHLSFHPAKGGT